MDSFLKHVIVFKNVGTACSVDKEFVIVIHINLTQVEGINQNIS